MPVARYDDRVRVAQDASRFPKVPVIYVPGNHEYYDHDIALVDELVKHFLARHDADLIGAESKRNAVDQLVFIEHILGQVGIVRHG